MFTFPHTVTLLEPGLTEDRYGDEQFDWDDAIETDDVPAWMQQLTTTEQIGGRDDVVTVNRCFFPPHTHVTAIGRLVWNDKTYAVTGDPNTIDGPAGADHIEVELRAVAEAAEISS